MNIYNGNEWNNQLKKILSKTVLQSTNKKNIKHSTKKTSVLDSFTENLMISENIVFDVCAKEITKEKAIIDIMKLIYDTKRI
tara:strand:- start:509 stop:754 length:246 start_codon:yes stop_codon:yes gene_type:complete